MSLHFKWSLMIAIWVSFSNVLAAADLAEHPEVKAAISVLEVWIQEKMIEREQPGVSIGVVHDQDLIWAKGYGFADLSRLVPSTPSTTYRIASISKPFTATAIMQLRDAGRLQLDDPVSKHLSWFKLKNPQEDVEVITIRHLLTHTSGMPREATGVSWNDYTFPDSHAMRRNLAQQEAVFETETVWKYSNLGFSIAGEVVAQISGRTWAEYVDQQILKPLGMKDTHTLPAAGRPGQAVGYGRRPKPGGRRTLEPFVELEAVIPAGNMTSNVKDLARFMSLQFRDRPRGHQQILKGASLREMHRVHWLRPDWQNAWGLGFAVRRVSEQVRVGHGGSLPGYRTSIDFVPAEKVGVIVLTNADDGDPGIYLNQAFALVAPAIKRAVDSPDDVVKAQPEWQKYLGRYTWKHSPVHVMLLRGELSVVFPTADNPWESRWKLEPVEDHSFRVVPAQPQQEPPGGLFTFDLDDAGTVKRVGFRHFHWLREQQ